MKKGLRVAIVVVAVLAVLAGMGYVVNKRFKDKFAAMAKAGGRFGKNPETAETISIPVAVSRAKSETIADSLVLNGGVVSKSEVNIFSNVPGKVKTVLVREGDAVKRGQVLAQVDRSEAGLTYALAPVESTIDGVVNEAFVEVGASITPAVPLFQVIDMDEVEVETRIPERYVPRVKVGMRAEVSLVSYPGKIFRSRVSKLAPVVDPLTRTREARIHMENRDHVLKPGMFGEIRIVMRERLGAVVIPSSALVDRDGRSFVFLVGDDGRAVELEPAVDIVEGERLSVDSGIKPGDRVVVIGQQNLNGGDPVTVAEEIE
jgi:multidrug efflux pump subunit AcrA (membrane-fusion protein)